MLGFKRLLDPRVLTASYVQRDPSHGFSLSDYYFANPRNVEGGDYELIYYPAMLDAAPLNAPGGEARVLAAGAAESRRASLFSVFNKVLLPGEALNALREPDSAALQDVGRTTIARVFDDFSERHRMLKELVIAKTLVDGTVSLDAQGRVLESTTGAQMTADFGIPANRRGNLGGIVSALWSATDTDIGKQIDIIRDSAAAANSEPPTEIWLNAIAKQYLRNNVQFQEWAKYSAVSADVVLRGDMIPNLWGLNWRFYSGKYRTASGTLADFIPATRAILTPAASRPWVRATQGSTLVPKSVGVQATTDEALANTSKFYGPFSYAKLIDDPMSLYLYMGDKFGLHFADPAAVWSPTVFAA